MWLCIGCSWAAMRNTVLDAAGIRPAGAWRQLPWTDVVDVRRSCSALHYADVELEVRGRRRPVHVKERRGGADLAAVRSWWLTAVGASAGGAVEPLPPAGPA